MVSIEEKDTQNLFDVLSNLVTLLEKQHVVENEHLRAGIE